MELYEGKKGGGVYKNYEKKDVQGKITRAKCGRVLKRISTYTKNWREIEK